MFTPFPNVAQVTLNFIEFDNTLVNVFHVMQSTPFDITGLQDLAGLFVDWHTAHIAPAQSSSVGLATIVAKALDSETAPAIEYTTGLPVVGGQTTDPGLPANVTVAIKWTTGLRGRNYRGRTFFVGLCEGMVSGNKVSESVVGALSLAYNALIDELVAENYTLVVASRWLNKTQRITGVSTPILLASVDEWVDSQRRRLTGRGS